MSYSDTQPTSSDLRRLNSLEDFDNVIAGLKTELAKVTTLRNNYVPINRRLPPEVLCEIFLQLAKGFHQSYERFPGPRVDHRGYPDPHAWVKVTHVCRHWRDIALNFPSLWTSIYNKKPEYIHAFIARSQQAPLNIREHYKDNVYMRKTLNDLLRERFRWRAFECTAPVLEWPGNSIDGAPQLEELRLREPFIAIFVGALTVSPFYLPRLRRVHVEHVTFPFVECLLAHHPSITALSMEDVSPPQSPAVWLDVLSSLSSLEELKLSHVLWIAPGTPPSHPLPSAHRISFPKLRRCDLSEMDEGRAALTFFDMITIPSSTALTIEGEVPSVDHGDIRRLFQTLGRGLKGDATRGESPRDILACRVQCLTISMGRSILAIEAWTCPVSMRALSWQEHAPEPNIFFKWDRGHASDYDACRTVQFFLDDLPLSKLRSFHFSGCLAYTLEPEHFSKLQSVRELCADYLLSYKLHPFPWEQEAEFMCPSAAKGAPIPFPNLEHLTLTALYWYKHRPHDSEPWSEDVFYDVRSVLRRRKASGLSLKSLNLSGGINIVETEARMLVQEGLVGAVEVRDICAPDVM